MKKLFAVGVAIVIALTLTLYVPAQQVEAGGGGGNVGGSAYGFELSIVSPPEVTVGKTVYDVNVVLKNSNHDSRNFSVKVLIKNHLEVNNLYPVRTSPGTRNIDTIAGKEDTRYWWIGEVAAGKTVTFTTQSTSGLTPGNYLNARVVATVSAGDELVVEKQVTFVPSPTPVTPFCSDSVDVKGAAYVRSYRGQDGDLKYLYNIPSGGKARVTVYPTPVDSPVNWKIVGVSYKLPDGGYFSYPEAGKTLVVDYWAPINYVDSAQGVDIRGDLSDYPQPWVHCPTITFAVQPNDPPLGPVCDGGCEEIRRLYREVLGREPDVGGLKYWYLWYKSGMSIEQMRLSFCFSLESFLPGKPRQGCKN